MASILFALFVITRFATPTHAGSVEVRLVHSYEEAGRLHEVTPCEACEVVEVHDPLRRAEKVSVSPDPDLSISFPSIRALAAFEPRDRSDLHRLLIFVDSSTQTALEMLRARGDTRLILVSIGSHKSLGRLDATSPWQIDVGYLGTEKEVATLLSGAPPVHFLPEIELVTHTPEGASPSLGDVCRERDDGTVAQPSSADYLWVSGTTKEGRKHGLWVYVDHRGELVQLQLYRRGCLVGRVLPYESEDDQRMKDVLRRLEETKSPQP